ncbi:MAG: DUF2631 domain-containing protein [Pseudonocardiales bacterium]
MAATSQHPTDEPSTDVVPHGDGAQEPSAQEPSAQWGWHGTFPKATAIAGWITAIAMFAMLIGNHTSYVEDVWLIALGTLLVIMLIGGHINQRRSKRP